MILVSSPRQRPGACQIKQDSGLLPAGRRGRCNDYFFVVPGSWRLLTAFLLAVSPALAGCAGPAGPVPAQQVKARKAPADFELAPGSAPWGGCAVSAGGASSLIAAALHDRNAAGFWEVEADTVRPINEAFEVGYHPDSVAACDPDTFAVAVEGAGKILFLRPGRAGVSRIAEIKTPFPTRDLLCPDLDGDGTRDLVLAPYSGAKIAILWGEGGYAFAQPQFLEAAPTPWHPRLVDWNQDGLSDLIWADWDTGSVRLYENQGDRRFELRMLQPPNPLKPRQLGVGDIDLDGRPDAVMALEVGKAARILYNRGEGRPVGIEDVPAPTWGYVSAEVMRDGTLALGEEGRVLLARKIDGKWRFRELAAGSLPSPIILSDLNHDGNEDLIVFNSAGDGVSVHFGPLWEKAVPIELSGKDPQ